MKKFHVIALALLLAAALILIQSFALIRGRTASSGPGSKAKAQASQTTTQASLSEEITLRAAGRGGPWINLKDGHDLITAYTGMSDKLQFVESDLAQIEAQAQPLALASGDFDEDGVPDLVSSYSTNLSLSDIGGLLTLHRGNVDAIYPNTAEAEQRKTRGEFTEAPFLSPGVVFGAAVEPDFIGAGDFNADGHLDVVMAARGSDKLYWMAGDGRGGFGRANEIELPGTVTALTTGEINRADGLDDVIVGIGESAHAGSAGGSPALSSVTAQVLVFEGPNGALKHEPEPIALPATATGLALGQLDDSYEMDLVVAAGSDLVVVHGRDRKLSLDAESRAEVGTARVNRQSLPFAITSLVLGDFAGDHRPEIALLSPDGVVHVLERAEKDDQWGKIVSEVATGSNVESANATEAGKMPALPGSGLPVLVRARVSVSGKDDVVVVDRGHHQLHIVGAGVQSTDFSRALSDSKKNPTEVGTLNAVTLDVEGEPIAVLPMRLTPDALSDLVVLKNSGQASLTVAPTVALRTFTVNNSGDQSDVTPGNGKCETAANNGICTLRAAIQEVNAGPGGDAVKFSVSSTTSTGFQLQKSATVDGGANRIEISNGFSIVCASGSSCGGNSTIRGFVISRSPARAIDIFANGGNNIIENNYLGTDKSGANAALGNTIGTGVEISSSPNNTIGGTASAARNIIAMPSVGIRISSQSPGNKVQGNYIGTDVSGTKALETQGGVNATAGGNSSPNQTIGGTASGARNVIACSGADVRVTGESGVLVQGNFIGTNAAGTAVLGGSLSTYGVDFNGSGSGFTVGGTSPAARNVISGNSRGVNISASSPALVQGNYIGTDVSATRALGNQFGVVISDSFGGTSQSTVGGTAAGARNVISGNTATGVTIGGSNNLVQGNYIGTDVNGVSNLGNGSVGVSVGGSNNKIGGTEGGASNIIAFNGFTVGSNVAVIVSGTGNAVRRNSIFGNKGQGILCTQNCAIRPSLSGTTGTLSGATPSTAYTIEFYSNDACGSFNTDEQAKNFLSEATVTGSGNATFNVPAGLNVTATATAPGVNTSTISNCISGTAPPPSPTISLNPSTPLTFNATEGGGNPPTQTVILKNTGGSTLNWQAAVSTNPVGGTWLSITSPSPPSGSLAPNNSITLTVSVNITSLSGSTTPYQGTIAITSSNASNSPQNLAVSVTVAKPDPPKLRMETAVDVQAGRDSEVKIEVLKADGTFDSSFNGSVQVSLAQGSTPDIGLLVSGVRSGESVILGMEGGKLREILVLQTPKKLLNAASIITPKTALEGKAVIKAELVEPTGVTTQKEVTVRSPLDLRIDRIEVQQGVREEPSGLWLKGRDLLIRVYVDANRNEFSKYREIEGITAQLTVRDQTGNEISGSPFKLDKGRISNDNIPSGPFVFTLDREPDLQGGDSLNHILFVNKDRLSLEAKLNDIYPDKDPSNNSKSLGPLNFVFSKTVNILYSQARLLNATQATALPDPAGIASQMQFTQLAYPVSLPDSGGSLPDSGGALRFILENADEILTEDPLPGFNGSKLWFWINRTKKSNVKAWVYFVNNQFFSALGQPNLGITDSIGGRVCIVNSDGCQGPGTHCGTLAHEIGHTYSMGDTYSFARGVPNNSINPRLPGAPAAGNPIQDGSFNWFAHRFALPSNLMIDFMGTSNDAWSDRVNWQYLKSQLLPASQSSLSSKSSQLDQVQQNVTGPFVIVEGRVLKGGSVQLGNGYTLTGTDLASTSSGGNYIIETLDANSVVLNSLAFEPQFRSLDSTIDSDQASFSFALPFSNSVKQIRIRSGSTILASRTVSSNAPSITFSSSFAGQTLQGIKTVSWTGSDADGNALTYSLFYSPDGELQIPLALDTTSTSYQWNTENSPSGPSSRLTLVATDGINGTTIETTPFTLPNRAPAVVILSPADRQQFKPGETVTLEGSLHDPEDGFVLKPQLTWVSNIQGALGTGKRIVLTNLAVGTHRITASGNDSQGKQGSGSISVIVTANDVSYIEVTPTSWNFGDVVLGQTRDLILTVKNTGNTSLTVNSITAGNSQVSVTSPAIPFTLGARAQQDVVARFAPSAAGLQTGKLTLSSNASNLSSLEISLSGTGLAAPPAWAGVVLTAGETEIKTWTVGTNTYAYLKLLFPNAGYRVTNWGQAVRAGNDFTADAAIEKYTGPSIQAVTTTAGIYDLGQLSPGNYNFTFKNTGTLVKSVAFTVTTPPFPANTIDTAREFVKQQYRDFLNREADPAGENFWTDNITKCNDPARRPAGQTEAQCTLRQRETTSGAFFLSPEFQYTGYYVLRMYKGALGRQPKLSEFIPDALFVGNGIVVNGQLSATKINQNRADFAAQFVNCTDAARYRCSEFKAIYDSLNNTQYVDKLFQTTGVTVSAADKASLVNALNGGTETRASVLQKVVDGTIVLGEGNQQFTTTYGQAFYDQQFTRAFVQLEYFGYMKRDPDEAGYAFWLGKLNQFGGNFVNAEMVLAFISSPEYRARFGQP